MSKEKPLTITDMREQVKALTQIVQLMVKQQGQIVEYLKSNDQHLTSIDQTIKEALAPVEFSEADMKLLQTASEA